MAVPHAYRSLLAGARVLVYAAHTLHCMQAFQNLVQILSTKATMTCLTSRAAIMSLSSSPCCSPFLGSLTSLTPMPMRLTQKLQEHTADHRCHDCVLPDMHGQRRSQKAVTVPPTNMCFPVWCTCLYGCPTVSYCDDTASLCALLVSQSVFQCLVLHAGQVQSV